MPFQASTNSCDLLQLKSPVILNQSYDHPHDDDDHLDGDHLVDVDESESQHWRIDEHCRCLVVKNLCHNKQHLIVMVMIRLSVVTIVIKAVMIIMIVPSQESNNKSEFNNCISTEREFLGSVGLSLKNAAYQYFCCRVVLAPSADMYYPFTTE